MLFSISKKLVVSFILTEKRYSKVKITINKYILMLNNLKLSIIYVTCMSMTDYTKKI
jgi:hypothetical protein